MAVVAIGPHPDDIELGCFGTVASMVGHEPVSAYRLETRVLGQPIVIHISTIGEILRADLPGGISATLDEWSRS